MIAAKISKFARSMYVPYSLLPPLHPQVPYALYERVSCFFADHSGFTNTEEESVFKMIRGKVLVIPTELNFLRVDSKTPTVTKANKNEGRLWKIAVLSGYGYAPCWCRKILSLAHAGI